MPRFALQITRHAIERGIERFGYRTSEEAERAILRAWERARHIPRRVAEQFHWLSRRDVSDRHRSDFWMNNDLVMVCRHGFLVTVWRMSPAQLEIVHAWKENRRH